jgi:hypothetical protein
MYKSVSGHRCWPGRVSYNVFRNCGQQPCEFLTAGLVIGDERAPVLLSFVSLSISRRSSLGHGLRWIWEAEDGGKGWMLIFGSSGWSGAVAARALQG